MPTSALEQDTSPAATTSASPDAQYAEATRLFGEALIRLACGYESNPEKRKDLLQEIHVALWRSFGLFDGRCSLRTWVYRVAHNTATKHIVAHRRIRLQELHTLDEIVEPRELKDDIDEIHRDDALAHLFELIAQLKPIDRQIILLYLEDLAADAIGEVVGLSAANVATKIHRIKKLLTTLFHTPAQP